jgi:hypothetical protein
MRVRPIKRQQEARRAPERRPHANPPRPPAVQPESDGQAAGHLRAEKRLRASGGPDDRAYYRCGCGFQFDAAVSTSVHCPHCGSDQSW